MKTRSFITSWARVSFIFILASHLLTPSQLVAAKPLSTFTDCATQTQIPETECNALVTLYNNMGGANWGNHTDWLQTDTPCSWYGVTCSGGTNVTGLSLIANNLSGAIPAELVNLTQLTTLELYKSSLSGSIPPELGNLSNLSVLNLRSNGLTGTIPAELGNLANLTELDLQSNNLNSPIPSVLANLTQLTTLNLSGNSFGGSIPTWLGGMTSLTELRLNANGWSGSIPTELGSLNNLTILSLYGNSLSGSIPAELGNLTNLTIVYLNDNQLSGSIPPEFGNMVNLTELLLNDNSLNGSIPSELGNLTQLHRLQLNSNLLTGAIPGTVGNMTALTSLNLSNNRLTGSPPTELGNLINLKALYLSINDLTGTFSPSITNLVNLMSLSFDCAVMSSDPTVLAFFEQVPYWQEPSCGNLIEPADGATLDNGRLDKLDDISWYFFWPHFSGASKYEIYVSRIGAATPLIHKTNLITPSYRYTSTSYIAPNELSNWEWKVRPYVNSQWGDWFITRTFSVEPPNTDPYQLVTQNGGFNTYPDPFRIPKYWKASSFSGTDGKNTVIKQEGTASIQISGVAGKTKTLSQTISFEKTLSGGRFIFSYRVKGSALPTTGICKGQILFYKNGVLTGTKTLLCPKTSATFAFTKMTLEMIAPAAYNKITVIFTYSKPSGTIWLDNVSLIT